MLLRAKKKGTLQILQSAPTLNADVFAISLYSSV